MLPLIASPWFEVIRVTTDVYPSVEMHKNKKLELGDFFRTEIHNQILQHLVADIVFFFFIPVPLIIYRHVLLAH